MVLTILEAFLNDTTAGNGGPPLVVDKQLWPFRLTGIQSFLRGMLCLPAEMFSNILSLAPW